MPITSVADFVTGIAGISPTGVVRQYSEPPNSLNTADLPASWPMLPSGRELPLALCNTFGWPTFTCDFIVAYEAVGQSRQIENFSGTITMMDSVIVALRDTEITKSGLNWEIRIDIVAVAEITYWAVIATVTGTG